MPWNLNLYSLLAVYAKEPSTTWMITNCTMSYQIAYDNSLAPARAAAIVAFMEDFYRTSDTESLHEKYVESFTDDATLIMGSKQAKGASGAFPRLAVLATGVLYKPFLTQNRDSALPTRTMESRRFSQAYSSPHLFWRRGRDHALWGRHLPAQG